MHEKKSAADSTSQLARMLGNFGSTSSDSYLNYMQNKLDEGLAIKSTNEEEKYVYLLKRMSEFLDTEQLLNECLNGLKIMLLCGDFNEWFQMRMARMICFVCRATMNHAFMRCFVYDLLMLNFTVSNLIFDVVTLVVLFVRIWPELLNWPSYTLFNETDSFETTIKKNPVLCVVLFIVKNAIYESKARERTIYGLHDYQIYVRVCF